MLSTTPPTGASMDVDVLLESGALRAYRRATGDSPPDGWVRMSNRDMLALPRPPVPTREPEPPPPSVLTATDGSTWVLGPDGQLQRRAR